MNIKDNKLFLVKIQFITRNKQAVLIAQKIIAQELPGKAARTTQALDIPEIDEIGVKFQPDFYKKTAINKKVMLISIYKKVKCKHTLVKTMYLYKEEKNPLVNKLTRILIKLTKQAINDVYQ